MTVGIAASYWLVMLSLMCLFGARLVGQKNTSESDAAAKTNTKKPKRK
jgi:hypothetical protein